MARTVQQIYDEMIAEKESMAVLNTLQPNTDSAQTLLSDLTSSSKVAVWRLIFFVMAVGIWTVEKLFDEHVIWIENRATELIVGTAVWCRVKALEYQHGDSLSYIEPVYKYATINEANQIIKLASVNEVGGQVLIKVAKLVSDEPAPLSTEELDAFRAYMQKVKFAGVNVVCLSRDPDLLKVYYHVYYDPLVLSADGSLISDSSKFPVRDAINAYCKGLPFNGIFSVTELTDKIQQAVGVVNPVFDTASAKYALQPYSILGDFYNPNAGYLKVDPAFPLSDTITYTAI